MKIFSKAVVSFSCTDTKTQVLKPCKSHLKMTEVTLILEKLNLTVSCHLSPHKQDPSLYFWVSMDSVTQSFSDNFSAPLETETGYNW